MMNNKKELTLEDLQDVRGAAAAGVRCHHPSTEDGCKKTSGYRTEGCATPAPTDCPSF